MERKYATLTNRVKAGIIDIVLIFALIYSVSEIIQSFDSTYVDSIRIISYILIFCCYEPLLVSVYGATIGQSLCKIKVKKDADTDKNIPIHLSFLRYILKWLLGWVSFLSILFSDKSKAIHDYVVRSVVVEELKKIDA